MSNQSHRTDIKPMRAWTARHAHRNLRIIEDRDGRIWLRIKDLRQWIPGLAQDASLSRDWPSGVRRVPPSTDLYLEMGSFSRLTQKSQSVPTLKLRAWLETSVLRPARTRRLAEQGPAGHRPARDGDAAEVPRWQQLLDPRHWRIVQGSWGLMTVLGAGAAGSCAGVLMSRWLNMKGWNVDNHYLVWAWLALTVAVWAFAYNAAWMLGALRSGTRRSGDGFNAWIVMAMVALNVSAAAYMSALTAQNSAQLVQLWWAVHVQGDPPVEVRVESTHPDGRARRLSLTGGLGMGSTRVLRQALLKNPEATELVLDSPGGLVIEGFGLAQAIEASRIRTTMVLGRCASACTLPFLQGTQRLVVPGGVLGFHRSHAILGGFGEGWSASDHEMADMMRRRGVSEAFIERAFATPGWDIYAPGVDVLLSEGVVTAVPPSP